MTTNVLFICPHSAGKSLLAATYFRAATARHGLDVSINVAGPEPDDVNIPRVAESIARQGYTIGWNPQLVTEEHTAAADLIVSVGCPRDAIPTDKAVTLWDVPQLSEDFFGSVNAIHERVEALVASMH